MKMAKSFLSSYRNRDEKLLQQSLKVPLLVDLAENRSGSFIDELQEWLRITERILEQNRMPQCSELAGLRSKIVSAKYDTSVPTNKRRKHIKAVAYQTGMVNAATDFNNIIQGLWQTFSSHEQLKGLTSKILVSVNRSDALRILADEIELMQD